MKRTARMLLAIAAVAAPALATSFATVGWKLHNIHGSICREAAKTLGLDKKVIKLMIDANRDQDLKEVHKHNLRPNERYDPAHHFDRNAGETDEAAFRRAAAYVANQKRVGIEKLRAGESEIAWRAVGTGSHALQDLFSHSNFIGLSASDQKAVLAALVDPDMPVPAALRLTGYDRKTGGTIKADNFPHERYNLDGRDVLGRESKESKSKFGDSGHSRHKEAYAKAVEATRLYVDGVQNAAGGSRPNG